LLQSESNLPQLDEILRRVLALCRARQGRLATVVVTAPSDVDVSELARHLVWRLEMAGRAGVEVEVVTHPARVGLDLLSLEFSW
jgi:hypothetical protein